MANHERSIHLVSGKIEGITYLLLTSETPPAVNSITYGLPDSYIGKMISKRKTCKVPSRSIVSNPWSDWVEIKKKMTSDYSISEYKHFFDRKLPYYAISFSDRKIDSTQVDFSRYKTKKLLPEGSKSHKFWRIERELLIPEKNIHKYVVVERAFGAYEHGLNMVTIINLTQTRGLLTVHQENNLGHGVWERSTIEVDDERFVNKTWPTFRDLPDMWSKYF